MRSIERTLLAWIMGALSLGAVVIVLVTYLVTLDEMNEVFDADLKNVAQALGTHRDTASIPQATATPGPPPRSDVADPDEVVTITWTRDGRRIFSSDPRVAMPFTDREALTRVRIGQEDWIVYTDVSDDGVAQAAQRVAVRHERAVESASKIFLPLLVLVLFVAALMVVALRRGLRPLDTAARDVASRSAASLTPIANVEVPKELAPLVTSINGLMARLALALSAQRRFMADAAHELRTPLTALRLQLQLLQRSKDEAARAEATSELQAGIDRSQRLIEQLLHVARFEPDGEAPQLAPVDLGELVRAVVVAMSLKADARGIDLGARGSSGIVVQGDAGQLAVLLDNLVENALRYTPGGGVVDVAATVLDGRPALQVVDDGPGIAEDERERVFGRFYRTAQAAGAAPAPGGSGLGLAIVREIAALHGATVSLHTAASGRGLDVRVAFPA